MSKLKLPDDLTEFLRNNTQLQYDFTKCECGRIRLLPLGEHIVGEVWIGSAESADTGDPHAGEEGYYSIPAVNLVAMCKGYDPEYILLWLPESDTYGTWDCDHWELKVFPGVNWKSISESPLKYINAQWYPEGVKVERYIPWQSYPFNLGRPF